MTKQNALKAGKEAQKIKEEAKTAFENDDHKPDDMRLYEWVEQNVIVHSYHTFQAR